MIDCLENIEELVEIPATSKWPREIAIKSIDGLNDIFYLRKLWKTVTKIDVFEDIKKNEQQSVFWKIKDFIQEYEGENLIIGFNPFEPEYNTSIGCSDGVAKEIINVLTRLKTDYENRIVVAKVREPKQWHSFESEEEVNEAGIESTRDKISVEWIGNLEKRAKIPIFVDVESDRLFNGYVDCIPANDEIYDVLPLKNLDVSVQVKIALNDTSTQTKISRIIEEFSPSDSTIENEIVEKDEQQSAEEYDQQIDFEIETTPPSISEPVDNTRLNYFKTFINIKNRCKKISCVAWHPTQIGLVAIAYINEPEAEYEHKTTSEIPLKRKKSKVITDDDIKINEPIFDITSRKVFQTSLDPPDDNFDYELQNNEIQDEHSKSESNVEFTDLIIYKQVESKHTQMFEHVSSADRVAHTSKDFLKCELDRIFDTANDINKFCDTNEVEDDIASEKNLANDTVVESASDEDSSVSDFSIESDTSVGSLMKSDLSQGIPIYDDEFSNDSESVDDNLPITDTNSSVLIWSCDNDLSPKMSLYNVQDVNVIKFHPYDGSFLAGGSNSGQLIVWKLKLECDKQMGSDLQTEDKEIIDEFMENLPHWETEETKYPTLHPIAISVRNISHIDKITHLEWMNPSLKVTANGNLKGIEGNEYSRQVFTSSSDGYIKIWDLKCTQTSDRQNFNDILGTETGKNQFWYLLLVYNIMITNTFAEKYTIPITMFKIYAPPASYTSVSLDSYKYVPGVITKYCPILMVANNIGEVGVIQWHGRNDINDSIIKFPENCVHRWWNVCHDGAISSISQNYYFPNIILTTGGRICALWNADYENGPIWWQMYTVDISLNQGCFTPFHPGIMYIARADGRLDIWNITKQIHKPVLEITATEYSISFLSVATPPSTEYQIGIADSNGNFNILKNHYGTEWDAKDYVAVSQFFKLAEENKKQFLEWNKTWRERCTVTDDLNFEHDPIFYSKKPLRQNTITEQPTTELEIDYSSAKQTNKKSAILDKVVNTEEYKNTVSDVLEKMKKLNDPPNFVKFEEKLLSDIEKTMFASELTVDSVLKEYYE